MPNTLFDVSVRLGILLVKQYLYLFTFCSMLAMKSEALLDLLDGPHTGAKSTIISTVLSLSLLAAPRWHAIHC